MEGQKKKREMHFPFLKETVSQSVSTARHEGSLKEVLSWFYMGAGKFSIKSALAEVNPVQRGTGMCG